MIYFISKRILLSLLIVWGILTICFIIMHMAPGNPASIYIRPGISAEVVANIKHQMGFDLPVWQQYFIWLKQFMTGNFGQSFSHHRPVSVVLGEAIPNTLQLTGIVFIVQYIIGILLGVITAVKKNTKLDHTVNSLLLFLYSMPGFWLALILILIFSLKIGWLPSSHMKSLHDIQGFFPVLIDRIQHLLLPTVILSIPFIAYTARYVRESLSDELEQPYIRTAKAFGVNKNKILFHYALKNALLPQVTLLGLYLPFLLGGAVITEFIFAWPGIGRIAVNAIFTHDYPLILAINFIAGLAVIIGNLISDILYYVVDPRIRIKSES